MFGKKLDRQVPRKPLPTKLLNDAIDVAEMLSNITASPPLEIAWTPSGPLIRWAGGDVIKHGRASTNFTARSGTAFGFGMVTPGQNNEGVFRSTPNIPDIKVWNDLSGAAPTAGSYVKYTIIDGQAALVTAEC